MRQNPPVAVQCVALLVDQFVELADAEIGVCDVRDQRQVARTPVGLAGLEVGLLRLDTLLDLAPDVQLPVRFAGQAVAGRIRCVGVGEMIDTGQRAQGRHGAGLGLADGRARDFDPGGEDLQIEAAGQRLVDQLIEIRIAEALPPLGLDRGRPLAGFGRRLRPVCLDRRVGALVLRSGQTRAAGAEQRGQRDGQQAPGASAQRTNQQTWRKGHDRSGYGRQITRPQADFVPVTIARLAMLDNHNYIHHLKCNAPLPAGAAARPDCWRHAN